MNKPLSEWTLGEIQAECKRCNGNCIGAVCPMVKWISKDEMACVIIRELRKPTPASWDLSESPRWTEQDKEDARKIKAIFPESFNLEVNRLEDGRLKLFVIQGLSFVLINDMLLPSLKPGEAVTLDEIIGGAE